MDSDQKPPQAFMTALTTEHFALQGARSTLTAESASRAALYLASLTGSLIALGFVTRGATVSTTSLGRRSQVRLVQDQQVERTRELVRIAEEGVVKDPAPFRPLNPVDRGDQMRAGLQRVEMDIATTYLAHVVRVQYPELHPET